MDPEKEVEKQFGHRLRVRVSGICLQSDHLLLVEHKGLGAASKFWAPPGGEMEFGSSAKENLQREFIEETGLKVDVGDFICAHEFIGSPLHAVELFFRVYPVGGVLMTGHDPELNASSQLIQHVSYMNWPQIKQIPKHCLHQLLQNSSSLKDLLSRHGYYNFSV